jgi:hypothetical protein
MITNRTADKRIRRRRSGRVIERQCDYDTVLAHLYVVLQEDHPAAAAIVRDHLLAARHLVRESKANRLKGPWGWGRVLNKAEVFARRRGGRILKPFNPYREKL